MADITISDTLAELQRASDAAREAVGAYHRSVGRPVLEWTDEECAEGERLQAVRQEAAAALQAAIEEDGQEVGQAYEFRRALRRAAYGEDYAGQ
ncbi:hypothetical protein [Streptomyces sp. MI02-7b]|uniref:hypothetical protein n=1 Tax=Streptomyces sp. MI02-7b TaxID=462941 RepID=UPI0029B1F63C|nr:hypothetical protein [Streptomyces sp. MI02-7b]MDX3074636.1 hypothetical protein [Streptomyces sp. MI02-7b]